MRVSLKKAADFFDEISKQKSCRKGDKSDGAIIRGLSKIRFRFIPMIVYMTIKNDQSISKPLYGGNLLMKEENS